MDRNLSPQKMFQEMAKAHRPRCAFRGSTPEEAAAWKAETLPQVMATLGTFPDPVDPAPEQVVAWEEDGLIKERWLINVGPHCAAMFQINRPIGLDPDEKRPALMCWHGHGPFGMEAVMGNRSTDALQQAIKEANYDYGHQMAKAGFVTFAIDWMGFGYRNDSGKPHFLSTHAGRDWCNIYYLHATMFGMTALSINLAHGKAATDFACTLPNVDSNRLGVMGLSGGGTMTLWTALCDERFKAAEIICYSDLWEAFGMRDVNYCGSQVAPGLYTLVDLPDLQGLLAPLPLLVDIGVYDDCFRIETSMKCFQRLRKIYEVCGVADRLDLDRFAGNHAWGGHRSFDFFSKHLKM